MKTISELNEWRRRLPFASEAQVNIDKLTISQSAVDFATELAALCDKHAISAFEGGFRVRSRQTSIHSFQELDRDLVVSYSAIDQRGRPRRQLSVSSVAQVSVKIDHEPDTSN